MQTPKAYRHGRGWRGAWREDGRQRVTPTVRTKSEALRLVAAELARLEQGVEHREPITFGALCDLFLAQHQAGDSTMEKLRSHYAVTRRQWEDVPADALPAASVLTWFNERGYSKNYRGALMQSLRQACNFGVRAGLLSPDVPLLSVSLPKPKRGEKQHPFESWAEVELVAAELGRRWGAFVIFAVDTGARPQDLRRLEHRHVEGNVVYLPGLKTSSARRKVVLTERGVEAYQRVPQMLGVPYVFHGWRDEGEPLSEQDLRVWGECRWHPALEAAGLAHRSFYQTRHTFAYFSLRAGVPISDLAREMGHENVQQTYGTYGHWANEMGDRCAVLRSTWAREQEAADANVLPDEAQA